MLGRKLDIAPNFLLQHLIYVIKKKKNVRVCELLWCKSNKTPQDVLFLENHQLQGGPRDSAAFQATSHRALVDHFPTNSTPWSVFLLPRERIWCVFLTFHLALAVLGYHACSVLSVCRPPVHVHGRVRGSSVQHNPILSQDRRGEQVNIQLWAVILLRSHRLRHLLYPTKARCIYDKWWNKQKRVFPFFAPDFLPFFRLFPIERSFNSSMRDWNSSQKIWNSNQYSPRLKGHARQMELIHSRDHTST